MGMFDTQPAPPADNAQPQQQPSGSALGLLQGGTTVAQTNFDQLNQHVLLTVQAANRLKSFFGPRSS